MADLLLGLHGRQQGGDRGLGILGIARGRQQDHSCAFAHNLCDLLQSATGTSWACIHATDKQVSTDHKNLCPPPFPRQFWSPRQVLQPLTALILL